MNKKTSVTMWIVKDKDDVMWLFPEKPIVICSPKNDGRVWACIINDGAYYGKPVGTIPELDNTGVPEEVKILIDRI